MNIWGYLDAVFRFPFVPQFESFFGFKLILCVITKTVAYSVGFLEIHKWALLFLSALFLNVWLLPILYVLVVPYGDSSQFRTDRDILLQGLLCLFDSHHREALVYSLGQSLHSARQKFGRVDATIYQEKNWI